MVSLSNQPTFQQNRKRSGQHPRTSDALAPAALSIPILDQTALSFFSWIAGGPLELVYGLIISSSQPAE